MFFILCLFVFQCGISVFSNSINGLACVQSSIQKHCKSSKRAFYKLDFLSLYIYIRIIMCNVQDLTLVHTPDDMYP